MPCGAISPAFWYAGLSDFNNLPKARILPCREHAAKWYLKNGVFERMLFSGKHRYSKLLGYEVKPVPMIGFVKACDIMREYIGRYKSGKLLAQKEEISKFVFERLSEHQEYYIERARISERICSKIGTISVSGGSGILEQLKQLF